jgi:hypothetical protein
MDQPWREMEGINGEERGLHGAYLSHRICAQEKRRQLRRPASVQPVRISFTAA